MADNKLEVDVEVLKTVVSKLDTSIEKIAESTGRISELLAVHEQRLNSQDKFDNDTDIELKVLHKRVTETTSEIIKELHVVENRLAEGGMTQHNQLSDEIKDVGERVTGLERWKWYVVGAVVAIGALGNSGILSTLASVVIQGAG